MLKNIPNDPFILLSYVNTKLRDNYPSLHMLCDDLNISQKEIEERLNTIGYTYNASLNKFI